MRGLAPSHRSDWGELLGAALARRPRLLFKITVKIQDGMLVISIGKPLRSSF